MLVVQIAAAAGVVVKDHIVQIGAGLLHAGLVERVRLEVDGGTVAGLELHGNVGAPGIAHPNDQLAGELVAVVRPALKGDGDRPFKIALGYEGQIVDLVVADFLVLVNLLLIPLVIVPVEGALPGGGQLGEPDPSHLGTAGLVVDELVEVVIVEVHRVVDVHIVRHVAPGGAAAPAAAHLDDQVAVELIPGVRSALEGQGNRPLIIPLGHKGQVVDLVPVELLFLLYFAFTGVAIVVVEGALAGGGQVGEEDVIDLGAVRLVVGIVVKIVHVQIHGVVDIHLIGHFAVRG